VLPVHPIDLEPFRVGDADDRRRVAQLIDEACCDSGFLVVTGHGVPQPVCDGVLDAFAQFFEQPIDEKRNWIVADESANRGYSAVGKEGLAYSRGDATPPDLFEAFNVGREDVDGAYFDAHRSFYAPNLWPTTVPGLAEAWRRYEAAVAAVADVLLEAMALALDLPQDWFVERCRRAVVTTRANNYVRPEGSPPPTAGQMRMGAHTDYGTLTILLADEVPGLQVLRSGEWHDVSIPRGSFICNLGDLLQRWTNDRWTSTMHRVVPPPANMTGAVHRRSLARFLDCEPDAQIECIPSCCSAEHPAKYGPVIAGEWLMAKIIGSRTQKVTELA
jgi:isopenicillin N synthase-like dioxygenase